MNWSIFRFFSFCFVVVLGLILTRLISLTHSYSAFLHEHQSEAFFLKTPYYLLTVTIDSLHFSSTDDMVYFIYHIIQNMIQMLCLSRVGGWSVIRDRLRILSRDDSSVGWFCQLSRSQVFILIIALLNCFQITNCIHRIHYTNIGMSATELQSFIWSRCFDFCIDVVLSFTNCWACDDVFYLVSVNS